MYRLYSVFAAMILGLSWLVSSHFPPWMSWHSELVAFITTLLFAWTALAHTAHDQKSATVSVPLLILPFVALMLLALIQGVTGMITYWGDVWVFLLYMVLCLICATLGFGAATHPANTLAWLAMTLVLGAFASALIAWVQVFSVWEAADWIARMPQLRRPGGNLGQPNQLATLLLMGIASLMFLYESGWLKAASSALIFAVLGVGLAMTESRTGVLSFLLLALWWAVRSRSAQFKMSAWAVGLACMAFLGFFWTWPSIFTFIWQNTGTVAIVDTKPGYRLIVWPQLLEALAQRPWFGWGLNQVPKAQNAVASEYFLSEPYSYSHNIVIDLALGVGLPLTVLLVAITLVWLWRRIRFVTQLMPWYCVAVVFPVAVHSMLEYPFTYAYFLVPVMLALGVLEGLAGAKPMFEIGVRLALPILLVVSAVAAWSVVEYVEVEEDFRVARFEALNVGQTPLNYERPHIVLLTQLNALLAGARLIPKPGMNSAELALAEQVALRFPWIATGNRYALSLALNSKPVEAMRQLRVMRALHGEKEYAKIRANWTELAQEKYPVLRGLELP